MTPLFARFARWVERQVGRSSTFVLAIAVVVLWAVSGPVFGWSDTWQLIINTGTTIVTFLMVFVIQNTQSRDTQAMQLKLDELIRVNKMARNSLDQFRGDVRHGCRTDEGSICSACLHRDGRQVDPVGGAITRGPNVLWHLSECVLTQV